MAVHGGEEQPAFVQHAIVNALDADGDVLSDTERADLMALIEALQRQAQGNDHDAIKVAIDALARYYSQGEVFPRDTARAQKLMSQAAKDGNAKAALDIAYQILSGTPDENQRADALGYLKIVAKSGEIGQRAIAESLMRDLQASAAPTTNVSEITP